MSKQTDLTRWNRSGLSRFIYVHGNAATFLEGVRESMADRFNKDKWELIQTPEDLPESNPELEPSFREYAYNKRLLEQYDGKRADLGWEIVRTFSRACHVLAGHIDAHANEAFLRTATEWEYIRRLVAMIDYHPAIAASAATQLVFVAKDGKKGVIPKGFQVRYTPPNGGQQVIFETTEDVYVSHELNGLRPKGWNISEDKFIDEPDAPPPWFAPKKPRVEAGQVAVAVNGEESQALRIKRIDSRRIHFVDDTPDAEWKKWQRGTTRLMVAPRWRRRCHLNGLNVIRTAKIRKESDAEHQFLPHGLNEGAYVAWEENEKWRFAEVVEADEWGLRLWVEGFPPDVDTNLYEARPVKDKIPAKYKALGSVTGEIPLEDVKDVRFEDLLKPEEGQESSWPEIVLPEGTEEPSWPEIVFPEGTKGVLDINFAIALCFMFPSPKLPPELAKLAVKLLLTAGEMKIPSSGERVFGSFGPKFEGDDLENAIKKIYDGMTQTATDKPHWKTKNEDGTPITDEQIKKGIRSTLNSFLQEPTGKDVAVIFRKILQAADQPLLVPFEAEPKVKVGPETPRFIFSESSEALMVGDWVVGDFKKSGLIALKIEEITPLSGNPQRFSLLFDEIDETIPKEDELQEIYTDFRDKKLKPEGSESNKQPASAEIKLELDPLPDELRQGRKLVLAASDGKCKPMEVTVTAIKDKINEEDIKEKVITITPHPSECFKMHNLIIHGNVVEATHGAIKPGRRISSGTTPTDKGAIVLDVANVASVRDDTFPTGHRAGVQLTIDGILWKQVPRLSKSKPTHPHYVVRVTEKSHLRFEFGDGTNGRRLPAGTNNVHIQYRVGAGRHGNVKAGSLVMPVHPHPLVAEVKQPFDAQGGEDKEQPEVLRERAPATLLALERAVSLTDFENLAMSRPDVWQAKASQKQGSISGYNHIRIVVIPAGGGSLEKTDPLKPRIESFLQRHAVPFVRIEVIGFREKIVGLDVEVRVDYAKFDPVKIVEQVRSALLDALSIEKRRIGQALYLSELYQVVESIEGVEDSKCAFTGEYLKCESRIEEENTWTTAMIEAMDDQVVYFSPVIEELFPDSKWLRESRYEP
jgi:uncharacterized phage protein gp47/JayE